MTAAETSQFITGGIWRNIAPELRPSITRSADGNLQPFYLTRAFQYREGGVFEGLVINYADPDAKVPLVKINIKGHLAWRGPHPVADGAFMVDYLADIAYEVTPLHKEFAAAVNRVPAGGLNVWETGVMQDVVGKSFPAFGLTAGEVYIDYDLIYLFKGMIFNGSKNVDGRPFDRPANRPTNLQVPLIRGLSHDIVYCKSIS